MTLDEEVFVSDSCANWIRNLFLQEFGRMPSNMFWSIARRFKSTYPDPMIRDTIARLIDDGLMTADGADFTFPIQEQLFNRGLHDGLVSIQDNLQAKGA